MDQVLARQLAQQTEGRAGPEGQPSGQAAQAAAGRRYAERVPGLSSPSDTGRSDRLSTSARISLSGYRR